MNACPTCKNDLVCHDQDECLRPTPETDAEEFALIGTDYAAVKSDFARHLERERNEARQAFAIATDQLVQAQGELRQAREENARLREALSVVLGAGWDGPLPSYIREQAAQLLTP